LQLEVPLALAVRVCLLTPHRGVVAGTREEAWNSSNVAFNEETAMRIVIPNIAAALAVAASLAWPISAQALGDLVLNVNCTSGDRIASALGRLNVLDRRMVIVISGTCTENVTIERDDVVLRAQGSGGGVSAVDPSKPAILINGARRVLLEGLTVVGGLFGVQATDGASVTIRASSIGTAVRHGVYLQRGASGVVDGSTVEKNGQSGLVVEGSSITLMSSYVLKNAWSGVGVSHGSSAYLGSDAGGNVCCGNEISDNTLDGVIVAYSSMVILNANLIERNARSGVLASDTSSIALRAGNVIRQNLLAGGIFVRAASSLRAGPGDLPLNVTGNEISGNTFGIQAVYNSNVDLRGGASVTGNTSTGVYVYSGSNFRTDGSTITGNGTQNNGPGIFVTHGSSAEFFGSNNIISNTGAYDFDCGDTQPSYAGVLGGNTRVAPNCTRFLR
jgi:hypothetical protein